MYAGMGDNRRLVWVIVAVTALFAAIDAAWLPFSTVSLDPRNLDGYLTSAAVLLAAYLFGKLILYRLRDDTSRGADRLRWAAKSLMTLVPVLAIFTALGCAAGIFSYLASATAAPLIDGHLAAIDAALGFHWPSFLEKANGTPVLATALVIAYHSFGPQIVGLTLVYSAVHRVDRLLEFLALLAVSSAFTAALMALFPTAGAYAYFQPASEAFEAFTAKAGMWHYADLLKLRSGEPFNLLVWEAQGLVTFPSYHTVVAIMIVYSLRRVPHVVGPAAFLNAALIVGTMPEGGHYLTDVIAGGMVAVVSILVIRTITAPGQERYEPEQTPTP
ncbi:phosphatase PAP2 family protein [Rhizobium ruizarguesonis]|uniref:Phosphatase PAP2 family protein n=1 Tax=Rhizobium ruizarguesonis TaxID=2081791 RepID=A0AAE8U0K9_9HYPH|nr:phosphatase PAP2 family protein [Rhizobium ruizarguesonis]TBE09641.1 phosphatase PAP2 family protein [Rhizobium ruizarguesonis]TBF16957.1 phosphatase PAP2 family protein [Rhizobium ruizarguesonis]